MKLMRTSLVMAAAALTFAAAVPAPELAPALLHPLPLAACHGLEPEAATPPPRAS